jgi:predicted CXXCH cytochrome family protein
MKRFVLLTVMAAGILFLFAGLAGASQPDRVHGGYTKNTNTCATCHAMHTARGPSLLQWSSIYDSCMACHDGTVSNTYNVQAGLIGTSSQRTGGGLFSTAADSSKSMHNVGGSVNIFEAPGGNKNRSGNDGDWGATFSCSSCHNPHGTGGNSRILQPNPNRINAEKTVLASKSAVSGEAFYYLPDYALRGFGYNFTVKDGATAVTADKYSVEFDQPTQTTFLKWKAGAAPAALSVTYTPSLRVTMAIDNFGAAGETVRYISGINEFCGACHRDYNAGKGSHIQPAGVYTQAYRHPVGLLGSFDWEIPAGTGLKFGESGGGREILCLTCHVAHGTDSGYWNDSLKGDYWAGGGFTFAEQSGSSKLKRIPNAGSCEACHQKSAGSLGYNVPAPAKAIPAGQGTEYAGAAACASCHSKYTETQADHLHTKKIQPAKGNPAFQPGKAAYDSWKPINDGGFQNLGGGNPGTIGSSQVNANGEIKLSIAANVWISRERFAEYGFLQGDKWRIRFAYPYDALTLSEKQLVDAAYAANGTRSRGLLYLSAQFYTGQRGPDRETVAKAADYANGYWVTYSELSVWQDNCFSCHTTGFDMAKYVDHYGSTSGNLWPDANGDGTPDHQQRAFKTPLEAGYIADYGVTCEACHGPGKNHAEYPSKNNIINPARLSVNRQNDACGTCHARNSRASFYNSSSGTAAFINPDGKYITINGNRTDATRADSYTGAVNPAGVAFRFDATTYRVMYPGEKLTDFVQVRFDTLSDQGLPNMHRMQWQEMMGYTKAATQSVAANDSSRSLKGRLVSCNTCHDSHKYNAQGESLKQSLAATCAACHAGAVNMTRAMPYIINAGGTNTVALNNQNDILNLRTHLFNVNRTDLARYALRNKATGVYDDTKLPPHDAFFDNIVIPGDWDRGLPAFGQ